MMPKVIPAAIAALSLSAAAAAETHAPDRSTDWRQVPAAHLMLIETEHGQIAIELNADFAPNHVEQMQTLARNGVYDDSAFYRVIDAFVAQGGLQDETVIADYPTLENENDRPLSDAPFTPLGNPDLFAPIVGHMNGFAVGRSESLNREWLLHCPGALAMARDEDPDSGGTEFYIVLDAQRYLDRNLTVFGRVIDGMEYVQKLKRGDRAIESGVIQAPDKGDAILSIRMAADLPDATRPVYRVMDTHTEAFEAAKTAKRVRDETFFYRKPPEVLDICGFDVPIEKIQ